MAKDHARRAAKQRRRANRKGSGRGPTPPRFDDLEFDITFDVGPVPLDPVTVATEALRTAGARLLAGRSEAYALGELEPLWQSSWEAVGSAADQLLGLVVREMHAGHWRPGDIVELAARRLDVPGRELLIDAVRASGAGALRHDAAWTAELTALGPASWRDDRSACVQRVALERWDRRDATLAVVRILVDTAQWPQLPAADAAAPRVEDSADTAMLAKVRGLLAKAESTEFEHEAETYTAKAQSLMARHAIDRAMLTEQVSTVTSVARVWIDAPYVAAKAMLVDAVARANRCRSVLSEQVGFCTVVGEATDVRAVVLLVTSLQVQAVRALARLGAPRRGYGTPSTRSFRQSFLVAFASRIGERLAEATTVEERSTDDVSRLLPVLAARSRAVDDRFQQLFPGLVTRSVTTSSSDGLQAGRAAADLAQLSYGETLEAAGR